MLLNFEGIEINTLLNEDKNQLWFLAQDVLMALSFSTNNSSKFLERYVSKDFKHIFSVGVGRPAWYIAEPGVYQLAFQASNKKSLNFQRWVFEEVLPSIRRNKVYISPDATKQDIINAAQDRGINLALEINDQQALLAYNAQLQNRCIDFDGLELDYLSMSQVLEKAGFKLSTKIIDNSLPQIGKMVKKSYITETGKEPKITIKNVGSNHGTEIKSYPTGFHPRIIEIAKSYWESKGILSLATTVKE